MPPGARNRTDRNRQDRRNLRYISGRDATDSPGIITHDSNGGHRPERKLGEETRDSPTMCRVVRRVPWGEPGHASSPGSRTHEAQGAHKEHDDASTPALPPLRSAPKRGAM